MGIIDSGVLCDQHTKELEERLLALEQQSVETDSENNSLKQLLER